MTKNTPWEGHTGAQVESFIKGILEKRIGVIYYDEKSKKNLCFADEDNKITYLANPTKYAHLLLASFDAGSKSYTAKIIIDEELKPEFGLNTKGNVVKWHFVIYDPQGNVVEGKTATVRYTYTDGEGKVSSDVLYDVVSGTILEYSIDELQKEGINYLDIEVRDDITGAYASYKQTVNVYNGIRIVISPENPVCGDVVELEVVADSSVDLNQYTTPVWNIVDGELSGDTIDIYQGISLAYLRSSGNANANYDRNITVHAAISPKELTGETLTAQKVISFRESVSASSGVIDTYGKLGITENTTYDLVINNGEGVNSDYTVVWSLSGDAFTNGHVSLGSRDKNQCEVVVNSVPDPWQNFTLIATVTSGGKSFTVQTSSTFVGTFEGYKRSIYRIIINQTYPEVTITEDLDRSQIEAIRNGSHRYLGKYTAENTMTICQLDDSDSTKYASGGSASLTGGTNYEGDVFMKLPPFWYYVYRPSNAGSNDIWHIDFAADGDAPAPTFQRWDGNDLIGVYKASNPNGVNAIYSLSGYVPANSIAYFPAYARQRGAGYSLVKWEHHCMMAALSYAWYKTVDLVAVCGSGKDGSVNADGLTNDLGMTDTTSADSGQRLNIWGLEDWWNSRNEEIDNIKMSVTANEVIFEITDDDGVRTVTTPRGNNQISTIYKLVLGNSLDMLPTELGTDSTLGYKQTLVRGGSTTDTAVGVYRSGYGSTPAGPLRLMRKSSSSSTDSTRLAFKGIVIEEKNPATFKALTAINR